MRSFYSIQNFSNLLCNKFWEFFLKNDFCTQFEPLSSYTKTILTIKDWQQKKENQQEKE